MKYTGVVWEKKDHLIIFYGSVIVLSTYVGTSYISVDYKTYVLNDQRPPDASRWPSVGHSLLRQCTETVNTKLCAFMFRSY